MGHRGPAEGIGWHKCHPERGEQPRFPPFKPKSGATQQCWSFAPSIGSLCPPPPTPPLPHPLSGSEWAPGATTAFCPHFERGTHYPPLPPPPAPHFRDGPFFSGSERTPPRPRGRRSEDSLGHKHVIPQVHPRHLHNPARSSYPQMTPTESPRDPLDRVAAQHTAPHAHKRAAPLGLWSVPTPGEKGPSRWCGLGGGGGGGRLQNRLEGRTLFFCRGRWFGPFFVEKMGQNQG